MSISNQKGGVGKTTTAVNLGASLALLGKTVLLIDLDPQANATSGLGVNPDHTGKHIYHVMINNNDLPDVIIPTKVEGLFLAPSHPDLIGAEVELMGTHGRERILAQGIASLNGSYNYVLIDCPPSLGLLTLNALTACTSVIIPVQCEYYALEGLKSFLKTYDMVSQRTNPSLYIEGFLLTMYDPRTRLSQDIAENVRGHFNSRVFETIIPRNVRLCEAPSYGLPISLYDISSKGAQHYLMLAKEIDQRWPS